MEVLVDKTYSELSYEEQLALTQNLKADVLNQLAVSNNGVVPTDKDSVELLLKVADSLDKTTLSNRKIATESSAANDANRILEAMTNLVANGKNRNIFAVDPAESDVIPEPEVPLDALPDFEHAAGEEHVGVISENSEAFNKRMDTIAKAKLDAEFAELNL